MHDMHDMHDVDRLGRDTSCSCSANGNVMG